MKLQLDSHNVFRPKEHFSLEDAAVNLATRSLGGLPTLVQRSSSSSATSSIVSETSDSKSYGAGNSESLIIGLAVAIPLAVASVVLFFLHRRVKRKQRLEDMDDKHRSLDFGMGDVPLGREPKLPEMSVSEVDGRANSQKKQHMKGLSLDVGSPYLLPAAVQDSRESFVSMSRSIRDGDDPYRPVTMLTSDTASVRSNSRPGRFDNESVYTASSIRTADAANANLLRNASRMSRSDPFASPVTASPDSIHSPAFETQRPPPRKASIAKKPAPISVPAPVVKEAPKQYETYNPFADPPKVEITEPQIVTQTVIIPTIAVEDELEHEQEVEHDNFHVTPPSPPANELPQPPQDVDNAHQEQAPAPTAATEDKRLSTVQADARRVSVMGLRPLPPDDPADNPEQRANRIRSFYKEYFDDSKPNPTGFYPQYNPYADDYEAGYFEDGAVYDPDTGDFYSAPAPGPAPAPAPFRPPFAQGPGRRAMTPDPSMNGPRGRVRSNTSFQSTGHINNPAFRNGPRAPPKKQLPPPEALKSLPTPSKLRDDAFLINDPINFAPRPTYRDQRLGRAPDSPLGVVRPYSPAVAVHSPLLRSFDDLATIPSPHVLRKSGTFTSLDFAPPPRFRNADGNASDAGSIRSNRSGISAVQNHAIRTGAYRVSRLPQDMVGTRDDLAVSLKPSWDLRGVNPGST